MTLRLIARPSGILVPRKDFGLQGVQSGDLIFGEDIGYVASLLLGFDGNEPRLLKIDSAGNLKVTTDPVYNPGAAYTFSADRGDFSTLVDDAALGGGTILPMSGQFATATIGLLGNIRVWKPTFPTSAIAQSEFKTQRVNGLPWLNVNAALPAQAQVGSSHEFGLESSDAGTPGGRFSFLLLPGDFQVKFRLGDDVGNSTVSIAGSLPANSDTTLHAYVIVVGDDAVYWLIDNVVVNKLSLAGVRSQVSGSYVGYWVAGAAAGGTPQIRVFDVGAALPGPFVRPNFPSVSAVNAAQQVVMDLKGCSQLLDIISIASGGTATLQVEVSTDNVAWTSIDTLAAALTQAKHYLSSTVGATVALSPLAFRFVRITAGAAGAGFTTTLTVSAK